MLRVYMHDAYYTFVVVHAYSFSFSCIFMVLFAIQHDAVYILCLKNNRNTEFSGWASPISKRNHPDGSRHVLACIILPSDKGRHQNSFVASGDFLQRMTNLG